MAAMRDPNDPDDFPQQLPAWGAKPLHKDVSVEMDWVNDPNHPQDEMYVSPAVAVEAVNTYLRANTQGPVGNPDCVSGVNVHLHIGAGDDGAGGTRYGNWGGAQHTPGVAYQPNGVPNLTYQQFVRSRRRVFHWGWAKEEGRGGQATIRGWDFWVDHTKGRYGIAHELGHNLGLDHGGTAAACVQNGKPNYRSIMNYAAEKMGAATFSLGSSEWTPLAPLNPVFLYENDGLKTPDFADIQYLQNAPFHYYVAKGPNEPYWGVDWNRDGVISGHDHEIRAAPNYQKDVQGSPELGRYYYYTKKHSAFAAANADGASTPSLVRIRQAQGSYDNTILVYRTASGEIKWLRQPGGGFQCPNLYEGCLYWQSATVSSSSDPGGPVAAVQIFQPNPSYYGSELLIVVWKENGGLKYKMYDSQLSELVPATDVPDSQGVVYEPSLAYYGWAGLMLVYLKSDPRCDLFQPGKG